MLRLVTAISGLVLLWAVFYVGGRPAAPVIEEDVRLRTSQGIRNAGYDSVAVEVDGRDVTLQGKLRWKIPDRIFHRRRR